MLNINPVSRVLCAKMPHGNQRSDFRRDIEIPAVPGIHKLIKTTFRSQQTLNNSFSTPFLHCILTYMFNVYFALYFSFSSRTKKNPACLIQDEGIMNNVRHSKSHIYSLKRC